MRCGCDCCSVAPRRSSSGARRHSAGRRGPKPIETLVNSIRYGKTISATKQLGLHPPPTPSACSPTPGPSSRRPSRRKPPKTSQRWCGPSRSPRGTRCSSTSTPCSTGDVRGEGPEVGCQSTIVIHRDLKKTEVVIDWALIEEGGNWKVVDMVWMGESTIAGLREDQVLPLPRRAARPR